MTRLQHTTYGMSIVGFPVNLHFFFIFIFLLPFRSGASVSQNCNRFSWECANGDCIKSSELCDGMIHCADASDETALACIAVECPRYSFRCAYGACVGRSAECNGRRDCADYSDEWTTKCPAKTVTELHGNCEMTQFECDNRQCVADHSLCDGREDCTDGSDESVKYCAASPCASYAFRCGNGACIPRKRICNRQFDCVDGSDEHQILCNYTEPLTTPRPQFSITPPLPAFIPVTHAPAPVNSDTDGSCRVDNVPYNGDAYYANERINYGEYIPNYARIEYRCIVNHVIEGNATNVCIGGNWRDAKTTCQPKCDPNAISGITILPNCYRREDNRVDDVGCRLPVDPGTYATINCRQGYERTEDFQALISCGEDGRWSPEPGRCKQICGEEGSQGRPFVVGGYESNIAEVPWQAGIYMKRTADGDFVHICGGSIISARLVVSAMHCFWDPMENRAHNYRQFQIAVGKSRRGIAEREEYPVQVIAIQKIVYEQAYNHYEGNFADDIVVIVLEKYIEFKTYVAPVCFKLSLTYSERQVPAGISGKVAGWGLTESNGEPSTILKAVVMPTVSREECLARSPETFKNFITSDKFCAGYLNGVSVCEGDSGGGMVFAETMGKKTIYYLRGIVSTGVRSQGSCDNFRYATFTNVAKYTELLKQHFLEHEPKL